LEEEKTMTNSSSRPGKTTVSPDVLISIAKLSALSVPGVSDMASVPGGVNRLFRRGAGEGVRIEIENDTVYAELYLVFKEDVNIREVARNVQTKVARAIQEMVGMDVGFINIHIEDIDYLQSKED
jgi:uncharacterized alkaline shock family protein YloU